MREPLTPLEKELVVAMEPIVAIEVNHLDPIGLLSMDCPPDEYKAEIRDITLRLRQSHGDFLKLAEIMYVIFAYCFDLDDAKPESKYLSAAQNIMHIYKYRCEELKNDW